MSLSTTLGAPRSSKARRRDSFKLFTIFLGVLVAATILWPLLVSVVRVVSGDIPNQAADSSILGAATSRETLIGLRNTVVVVMLSGAVAIFVGGLFAWLNERTDARIGPLAKVLPLLTLFVPPLAGTIGWVMLLDPKVGLLNNILREIGEPFGLLAGAEGPFNVYSWYGMIFAYSIFLVPFAYLSIMTAFLSMDSSLEEASKVSGASPLRTFVSVTMPSMKPALGAAVLAITTLGIAMFSIPVIIGSRAGIDVLPVMIVHDITRTYPLDMTSALGRTILIVAIVGFAWLVQRRLLGSAGQGYATIGGKATRPSLVRLGRWRRVAQGAMWLYLLLATVLPTLGLLVVSIQPFWDATPNFSTLTTRNYQALFEKPILADALTNSFTLAATGATVVVIIAFLLAHVTDIWPSRTGRVVDGVVKLPTAVTHIFLAIALVLALAGPPFDLSGTLTILFIAYVMMYLAQGTFYVNAGIQQIGKPLIEASAVSGAKSGETARRIIAPLAVPSLVSGWGLVFILMMGDVTGSVMLSSTLTPVVGLVMLDAWTGGTFPQLASIGVVMTAVSATVVSASLLISGRWKPGGA